MGLDGVKRESTGVGYKTEFVISMYLMANSILISPATLLWECVDGGLYAWRGGAHGNDGV